MRVQVLTTNENRDPIWGGGKGYPIGNRYPSGDRERDICHRCQVLRLFFTPNRRTNGNTSKCRRSAETLFYHKNTERHTL